MLAAYYDLSCVSSSTANDCTFESSTQEVSAVGLFSPPWALSLAAWPPNRDVSAGFVSVNRMDLDISMGDKGAFGP